MDERKTILDYSPETYECVRQALLHVATILGEWMEQVTLIVPYQRLHQRLCYLRNFFRLDVR